MRAVTVQLATPCDQHRIHELLSMYGRRSPVAMRPTLQLDPAGCLAKLNGRSRVGANIGRLPVGWWPEQRRLFTPPSRPAEAWRGQLARSVRQKNLNNPGRVALLRPQLTRGR